MTLTLLANSLKPVLEKLCEPFGGIDQVSLTQSQLEYVSLFPGFSVIAKPWAREVNLLPRGFRPGTPYRVFDRDIKFLYEVCPPENTPFFGLDDRDLAELTFRKNGDYLHIQFVGNNGPTCGLIWIQNQIPPHLAKRQIDKWLLGIEINTPRQTDHELFADTRSLEASAGQLIIYFAPGSWEQQLTANEILLSDREDIIVSRREHNESLLLYPTVSGWYVFFQENSFGTRTFLDLSDRYGIGTRRIRQVGNAFFFQSQNTDLSPSFPDPRESINNTGPLNWASSNHRMRVETRLDYAFLVHSIGKTIVKVEAEVKIKVPCEDILASASFGGSEFLEVNELDASGFIGNPMSANDCYITASSTGENPASSIGNTHVIVLNGGHNTGGVLNGSGGSSIVFESDIYCTSHLVVSGGVIVNGNASISTIFSSSHVHVIGGTNEYTGPVNDANLDDTHVVASGAVLFTGEATIPLTSLARVFSSPEDELETVLVGETLVNVEPHKLRNGQAELPQTSTLTASASLDIDSSPVTITGLTTCISDSTVIMTCISPVDVLIIGETLVIADGELADPSDAINIPINTVALVASDVVHLTQANSIGNTKVLVTETLVTKGTLNLIMSGTFVKVDEEDPNIHLL